MILKTSQLQVQKTVLSPLMQQSIKVLLLPITDLSLAIDQELQENPLLEIDEKKTAQQRELEEFITKSLKHLSEPRYHQSFDPENDESRPEGRPITKSISLEEHLLKQLSLETSDPLQLKIGELIIGNLDEDGYLKTSCEEIAKSLSVEDVGEIEDIRKMIQKFEPLGIASVDLKDCLLIQIANQPTKNTATLTKVIQEHLDDIGRKKYQYIARKLKVSPDHIKCIAQTISSLEPKPARKYRPSQLNIYIKPDMAISESEGDEDDDQKHYQVYINNEGIPQLRINKFYHDMLKQPNRTKEELDFIREKIKNALFFMKSIQQRHSTLRGIAEYICAHQKDFFEHGHMSLKPMTLKNIAEAISRNESTISRAINRKYIDTPQGLYPMKFFFSQGLSDTGGGVVSNRSIKEEIRSMVGEENKSKPLSDQDIENKFKERGLSVARRTVNKYRKTLNILPSNLRKL